MESRFGIDRNSLSDILKSGVTSQSKVKEISKHLHTSPEGLPSFPAHISLRQNTYGVNTLSSLSVDRQSYCTLLKKSFVDFEPRFIRNSAIVFTILYLIFISVVLLLESISDHKDEENDAGESMSMKLVYYATLAFDGHFVEILLAIFVESTLRYRKQGKLERFLKRLVTAEKPLVKRDGSLVPVPLEDIVVGDICHVKPGDVVPGDGLLLFDNKDVKFCSEVTSNEGVFCSAGSLVSEGTGIIMIVAVGSETQISYLVNEPHTEKKLFNSSFILYFAFVMGTLIFLTYLLRFSIYIYLIEQEAWRMRHLQKIVTFFFYGLTAIVTLMPWFLPLVIILSLHNAQKTPGPLSKSKIKAIAVSNVLKFLQFIFVVNIILAILNGIGIQLSNVQRLWIFWSTNILAVTLFPSDTPKLEESKGAQIAQNSNNNMISECVKNVIGQAALQLTILFILAKIGPVLLDLDSPVGIRDPNSIQTMGFTTLALMSYCNLFHCRKIRDERDRHERNVCSRMGHHSKSWVVLILMFLLQIVIVQQGGLAFSSTPLNLQQWLICIFCALLVLLWGQILMSINASKFLCCCRKSEADPSASRSAIYMDTSGVADTPV